MSKSSTPTTTPCFLNLYYLLLYELPTWFSPITQNFWRRFDPYPTIHRSLFKHSLIANNIQQSYSRNNKSWLHSAQARWSFRFSTTPREFANCPLCHWQDQILIGMQRLWRLAKNGEGFGPYPSSHIMSWGPQEIGDEKICSGLECKLRCH